MIQIFVARDGAQMTLYVEHDEKQKVLTAFGKADPPKKSFTGSEGETLLVDFVDVVGVAIYPPNVWQEKMKRKRAEQIQKKRMQQGQQSLSDEERAILRDVMGGGGPEIVS